MTVKPAHSVLFVDDDPDDLLLIRSILEELSFRFTIHEAQNGKEALDYLEEARSNGRLPNLVVLDVNMPVMDGKQTLSLIRRNPHYATLPIVIFTTSNSELDRSFFRKFQVEMISKPPDYEQLKSAVLRILSFA